MAQSRKKLFWVKICSTNIYQKKLIQKMVILIYNKKFSVTAHYTHTIKYICKKITKNIIMY